MLSGGEVALGAALLVPVVPSALAGLGLAAFGAGLMQLYPGRERDHCVGTRRRPSRGRSYGGWHN